MGVNSLHWYYAPSLGNEGDQVALEGEEWHHCHHVMRLVPGDQVVLCDGKGSCMKGTIRSATKKEGGIEFTEDLSGHFHSTRIYKLKVAMAPTRNIDRTEFAVEKLVELGVDEICFLQCHHSERTHLRIDRMEKILIAAAKQSRKTLFPVLQNLMSPAHYVDQKKKDNPGIRILGCHLDPDSKSISENYLPGHDVVVLIGPEGDFSNEELEMLKQKNVQFVHLGPYRLRVETAAITACANIHFINEMKLTL